jgi:hypothetical protein
MQNVQENHKYGKDQKDQEHNKNQKNHKHGEDWEHQHLYWGATKSNKITNMRKSKGM